MRLERRTALVDVFRFPCEWISQLWVAAGGRGPTVELDERGRVKRFEADCFAQTALYTMDDRHQPVGDCTVLRAGEGRGGLTEGGVWRMCRGR